jgi:hypothetical protein
MSDTPKPYVVRQGDTILRIALAFGVDVEDIRLLPENAKLIADVLNDLLPVGEKLFIPPRKPSTLTVTTGTTNNFQATVPMHGVVIAFEDAEGPLANEPYTLAGLGGDPVQGALDGAGTLDVTVPVSVERLEIVFPNRFVHHTIWVGHLAPARQPAGVAARLVHLAYAAPGPEGAGPSASTDEEGLKQILKSFQAASGLDQSGAADDATLGKLGALHLC